MTLAGKTLFITGASRGIGLAIALRAARDGANIAIFAKTAAPHPKLPGTVFTAAREIEAAGGKALPLVGDVREEEQVRAAIGKTVETFGGLDALVNNASAISLTDTPSTAMKRYDLMNDINTRGTYLCTQAALPHLRKAANPHVLNIAPPLDLRAEWFAPHVAYSIAKFGMSLCTLGHSLEFRESGIAVNSLWPMSLIDTAAVRNVIGQGAAGTRQPRIMGDAAHVILTSPSRELTGRFLIDERVLRGAGVTDLSSYASDPQALLARDLFVSDELIAGSPARFTS